MSKMREQVVPKIRAATEGLSEMQKRILADTETKGAQWTRLDNVPGVYCVFRRGKCVYVGQSENVLRRVTESSHPAASLKGVTIYYLPLVDLSPGQRRRVEAELTVALRPRLYRRWKLNCGHVLSTIEKPADCIRCEIEADATYMAKRKMEKRPRKPGPKGDK